MTGTDRRGTPPGTGVPPGPGITRPPARRLWPWLALTALVVAAAWQSGYPAAMAPFAGPPGKAGPPSPTLPVAPGPDPSPTLPVAPGPDPAPGIATDPAVPYRIVPLTAAPRSLAAALGAARERRVLYVLAAGAEDWLLLAGGAAPHAGYHLLVDSVRESAGVVTIRAHVAVTGPAPALVSYPRLLLAVTAGAGRREYRLELDGVAAPTIHVTLDAGDGGAGRESSVAERVTLSGAALVGVYRARV